MPSFSSGGLSIKIDAEPFVRGFRAAPVATYFWLRNATERAFEDHRRAFLRQKAVRFNSGARGIKVPPVNADRAHRSNQITYRVDPPEKRRTDAPIREIAGTAFATSEALAALETGATITPKKGEFLAIPILIPGRKNVKRPPSRYARALPKKSRLITLRSRSGALVIYERIRERKGTRVRAELTKTGKRRKTQRATFRDRLIPRYTLTRSAKLPAALSFYRSWDGQRQARDRIFANAADRLLRDIAKGITT